MRILFALIACLLCSISLGFEKPSVTGIYDRFPERFKPWLIAGHKREIKRLENLQSATRAKKGKTSKREEKEAIQRQIDEINERIKHLKTVNDPPFVGMTLSQCHANGPRDASERFRWEVGDIGITDEPLKIIQVIDPTTCLIERKLAGTPVTLLVKGFATANQVDGVYFKSHEPVWVTGTDTYNTKAGTNTVLVLEPFDWGRYQQTLKGGGSN